MPVVAFELTEYVRPRKCADGRYSFSWEAPLPARKGGFLPKFEKLGFDPAAANLRGAELNERLNEWRASKNCVVIEKHPWPYGSVGWYSEEFVKLCKRRSRNLRPRTQVYYAKTLRAVCVHRFRNGEFEGLHLGDVPVSQVTEALADYLYDETFCVEELDDDGQKVERERHWMANDYVECLRLLFNKMCRTKLGSKVFPARNPFAGMGLRKPKSHTLAATPEQLLDFMREADRRGLPSLAALAYSHYRLFGRAESLPFDLRVEHYRPADRPFDVLVHHNKNDVHTWLRLFDDRGRPIFPDLVERLDRLKADRTTGPLFAREGSVDADGIGKPWTLKQIRADAHKICEEITTLPLLTMRNFRKGGMTEAGAAGLTDVMMSAIGGISRATAHIYMDQNEEVRQVAMGRIRDRAELQRKAGRNTPL